MPPTEQNTEERRIGADGETEVTPTQARDEVVEAQVPGSDPSKFVELTLAHPLSREDRVYLGLPEEDGTTEVGQRIRVSRNGAKAIINAGYAQVDPEDNRAVRAVLRGEDPEAGEPTSDPDAEGMSSPLANPPMAESTPGSPEPGGVVTDANTGEPSGASGTGGGDGVSGGSTGTGTGKAGKAGSTGSTGAAK